MSTGVSRKEFPKARSNLNRQVKLARVSPVALVFFRLKTPDSRLQTPDSFVDGAARPGRPQRLHRDTPLPSRSGSSNSSDFVPEPWRENRSRDYLVGPCHPIIFLHLRAVL